MRINKTITLLSGLCIASIALATIFDRQCEGSCLKNVFEKGLSQNLGSHFHISFGDGTELDDDGAGEDDSADEGPRSDQPLSLTYKDIKDIQIKSFVTSWTVGLSPDASFHLTFKDYRLPQQWDVRNAQQVLNLTLQRKGPGQAELLLPPAYDGRLVLASVSGTITIGREVSAETMEITTVSGPLTIAGTPRHSLSIHAVSADVDVKSAQVSPQLDLNFESVSGDLALRLEQRPQRLSFRTVSGDVTLNVPKSLGFDYAMKGVSSDFEGLPAKEDGGASGSATPLSFESVSGDFTRVVLPE